MSIRKRRWTTRTGEPRESWIADFFDNEGVRRLRTFDRRKDADAFLATVKSDVAKGAYIAPSRVTVTEAAEKWLQSSEAAGLGRATLKTYQEHIRLHIRPFIGAIKLSALTIATIRDFQDKLRAAGRSPDMVKRVTKALGALLADAQERGDVGTNPVRLLRRARRSKAEQKEKLKIGTDIPSAAEVGKILAAANGRWRPLFYTAAFTGARASELRALRWQDVDFGRGEIHIRRRADRFGQIDKPKSHAGERVIPIGPELIRVLKEWRLACPRGELDLCFPSGAGRVESHSNVVQRGFAPTLVRAGVTARDGSPKYGGLHALRHFFASWCVNRREDGGLALPLKIVQERLGHSTIALTADRYSHLFARGDDGSELAAAEKALLNLHAT